MRPVISNDGWMHAKSDILTLHHSEQDGDKLYSYYDDLYKLVEQEVNGVLRADRTPKVATEHIRKINS